MEGKTVAKNGAKGGGRAGSVTGRTQTKNPQTGQWTKRDANTGHFIAGRRDGQPFKGVRKER